MILNEETLCELEEISPKDFYSYDKHFEEAVKGFFNEVDSEDTFNYRTLDTENHRTDNIDNERVLNTI